MKENHTTRLNNIYKKSKWLHKYFGLILIVFFIWMSVSGILLNHPDIISNVSVPTWMIPEHYHLKNWNRSSLIKMLYFKKNPKIAFACGKEGVWRSDDGAIHFYPMDNGFPSSLYYRKTNDIYLFEGNPSYLYAATDGGLYICNISDGRWHKIPLPNTPVRVVKIIRVKDRLIAFTPSHAYSAEISGKINSFSLYPLPRISSANSLSFVRLFFDLHDGSVWGLPGRLLFDLAGIIVIFLSASAFYIWYFPWRRARVIPSGKSALRRISQKSFKYLHRYHLKLGIWFALLMLIIGGTGIFMRPPTLVIIANGDIPASFYPGYLPSNPWDEKIQNAVYDSVGNRIIIQATDGFWSETLDKKPHFVKVNFPAPVFVMGATVFETYGRGGLLIGSFNGIFHWERSSGHFIDLLTHRRALNISNVRPAEIMITGYFTTPRGESFTTAHDQGLLPVGNARRNGRFLMPQSLDKHYRMSLWNYMFEIHNARIFQGFLGGFYILVVPLCSILFVLILLSGIYDWLYLKILRKRL